jgi:prolyl oligopeptidase
LTTKDYIVLDILDSLRARIDVCSPPGADANWDIKRDVLAGSGAASTAFESIGMRAVNADYSNDLWFTVESFTNPSTLFRVNVTKQLLNGSGTLSAENNYGGGDKLKNTPAFFSAEGISVEQHWITSKDGTKVPYFLIGKDLGSDSSKKVRPTLLYGYGGFEIAYPPFYGAVTGLAWLEKGGAFALANIRGGGEFGPQWHQAALQKNRPRAYEVRGER